MREKILTETFNNNKLSAIARSFAKERHEDLFSTLLLILSELPAEKLLEKYNSGRFFLYCYRIMYNQACDANSQFNKPFGFEKNLPEDFDVKDESEEMIIDPARQKDIDESIRHFGQADNKRIKFCRLAKEIEENGSVKDKLAMDVTYAYIKEGSYRNVQKETGITINVVSSHVNKIKSILKPSRPMNIMLLTQTGDVKTGMDYYRIAMPYLGLNHSGNNIRIASFNEIREKPEKENFTYVINARPDNIADAAGLYEKGKDVILDIDDYWHLPTWHPYREDYKKIDYFTTLSSAIRSVKYVTCSTEYMADFINDEFGIKAHVVKNCIHPEAKFTTDTTESKRVRFGWIGGIWHLRDIETMTSGFSAMHNDESVKEKYQFCLGGYNYPNPQYERIEQIFTQGMKDCSYSEYLNEHTPHLAHLANDKPYRRLWALPVQDYGEMYKEIDVALIPLVHGTFNSLKSELKLVEAGMSKKAVICSDVKPYQRFLKHNKNCIAINNKKGGWYSAFKKMLDKSFREDTAEAMHELIKKNFDYKENVSSLQKYLNA